MNEYKFRELITKEIGKLGLNCGEPASLYLGDSSALYYTLTNNKCNILGSIEHNPTLSIIFSFHRENTSFILDRKNSKLIRELEQTLKETPTTQ